MTDEMITVSLYVPAALWREVEHVSSAELRSVSRQVQWLLRVGLEEYEREQRDNSQMRLSLAGRHGTG